MQKQMAKKYKRKEQKIELKKYEQSTRNSGYQQSQRTKFNHGATQISKNQGYKFRVRPKQISVTSFHVKTKQKSSKHAQATYANGSSQTLIHGISYWCNYTCFRANIIMTSTQTILVTVAIVYALKG